MTLPLSEMNRETLVRELRIAKARGDNERAAKVRLALYRKDHARQLRRQYEAPSPTTRTWWDRD